MLPVLPVDRSSSSGAAASRQEAQELPPEAIIEGVQFSLLDSEELKAFAVINVFEQSVNERRMQKRHSCMDAALGTTNRKQRCRTCKENPLNCQGHFGYIDLSTCPVINPELISVLMK